MSDVATKQPDAKHHLGMGSAKFYKLRKSGVIFRPKKIRMLMSERFWMQVDKSLGPDGCWNWQGHKLPTGHGIFHSISRHGRRKEIYVHRLAYLLHFSRDPGIWLVHLCYNSSCCNPAHLSSKDASFAANRRERKRRRRPVLKYNAKEVQEMVIMARSGISRKAIAAKFNGNRHNISRLLTGKIAAYAPFVQTLSSGPIPQIPDFIQFRHTRKT